MSKHHDRIKNDPRWLAARAAAVERDGRACLRCGSEHRLEVNHIVRLADGGEAFDLDNLETLCRVCHQQVEKSRPASRTVVLLFGPPASGKTTRAREYGLPLYDKDDPQWSGEAHFVEALASLGSSATAQAVVIRTGATASSRAKWTQLVRPTQTHMLNPGREECERRARARGGDVRRDLAAIGDWFARHEPEKTRSNWINPRWASVL